MRSSTFNTKSKFLSDGFSEQISTKVFFSRSLYQCGSIGIDSLLWPAIASMLLRICLSGFHLANAATGKGRSGSHTLKTTVFKDGLSGVHGLVLYPNPPLQNATDTDNRNGGLSVKLKVRPTWFQGFLYTLKLNI